VVALGALAPGGAVLANGNGPPPDCECKDAQVVERGNVSVRVQNTADNVAVTTGEATITNDGRSRAARPNTIRAIAAPAGDDAAGGAGLTTADDAAEDLPAEAPPTAPGSNGDGSGDFLEPQVVSVSMIGV
jgi:hypothetical protein